MKTKTILQFLIWPFFLAYCNNFQRLQNLPNYQNVYTGKISIEGKEIPITMQIISNEADDINGREFSKQLFAEIYFEKEKVSLGMFGARNHYDPNRTGAVSGDPIHNVNAVDLEFYRDVLVARTEDTLDTEYQKTFDSVLERNGFKVCPEKKISLVGQDFSHEIRGNVFALWCEPSTYRKKIGEFVLKKNTSPADIVIRRVSYTSTQNFLFTSSIGKEEEVEMQVKKSPHGLLPNFGKETIKFRTSTNSYNIYSLKKAP